MIKAILIDDEESARSILQELISRFCPKITVCGTYSDLEKGVQGINEHNPDVVFLDIQMPKYAGYEIINFFPCIDFEIIFVTAYDNYAIKAFDLSAVHYLLKPIEIEKLKIAVERLEEELKAKLLRKKYSVLAENLQEKTVKNIVFPHRGEHKILPLEDIIALEAQESYTRVYDKFGNDYTISKNLKQFENLLKELDYFIRTHKSWIINLDYVISFSRRTHEIKLKNELVAKTSKLKKKEFQERLTNHRN